MADMPTGLTELAQERDIWGPDGFLTDPIGDHPDQAHPVLAYARDRTVPFHIPNHSHFRGQLLYASKGMMSVHTCDGRWLVPPSQAVWVPPGTEHEVSSNGLLAMRSLYLHPGVCSSLPARCCVLTVPALLRELILRAVTLPTFYEEKSHQARLLAVIPGELEALTPEPLYLPLPQDPRLKVVTDFLGSQPGDKRDLSAWAIKAGASDRTLARLFVKETGMTFGAWRQRQRLLLAIARLAEKVPVTTIAYDLGYNSPSAFIAMFTKALGTTPSRYLERHSADER
ncbi:MAG: helix-turn-helix transcriptional regulator [Pseudomonadota bacterium]